MRSRVAVACLAAAVTVTGWMAATTVVTAARYGAEHLVQTDFALYYAFARIGLEFGWSHLYDLGAQAVVYRQLGGGIWWFPLPYVPVMGWLAAPFTVLPMATAYWVWSTLMAACLVGAWWLASPREPLLRALCLTAALSPYLALLGLQLGQVIPLQLLSVAAAYRLARSGREGWAGLALIGAALHPQAYFLVPIALLVAGYRRAFLSFAGAAAVLGLAMVAALGPSGVAAFIGRLRLADAQPLQFYVSFPVDLPLMFHSHHLLALGLQLVVAAFAVTAMWRTRATGLERPLAIALIASTLVTSFIHLDDLLVLPLAAWLVLRAHPHPLVSAAMAVAFLVSLTVDYGAPDLNGHLLVLADVLWLGALALLPVARPALSPLELPVLEPDAAAVVVAGGSAAPLPVPTTPGAPV